MLGRGVADLVPWPAEFCMTGRRKLGMRGAAPTRWPGGFPSGDGGGTTIFPGGGRGGGSGPAFATTSNTVSSIPMSVNNDGRGWECFGSRCGTEGHRDPARRPGTPLQDRWELASSTVPLLVGGCVSSSYRMAKMMGKEKWQTSKTHCSGR